MVKCSASIKNTHHSWNTRPYTDTLCMLFCGHTWGTWLRSKTSSYATIMLMRLFYRSWSWTIPSRQHYCLDWDPPLIIQIFRTSSPGATIHLRGQQVKTKMSGVVTPAMLKAATTRQDKHLQTHLIISQRVFDVAEREWRRWKHFWNRNEAWTDEGGDVLQISPVSFKTNIHLSNAVA